MFSMIDNIQFDFRNFVAYLIAQLYMIEKIKTQF